MLFAELVVLSLFAPPAQAFCGVYIGSAEDAPTNRQSRVVLARGYAEDADTGGFLRQTTLTLAADVQTDLSDFALVIPVPPGLEAADVSTVDPELVDRVFAWSDPRAVAYTCDVAVEKGRVYREGPPIGCAEYDLVYDHGTDEDGLAEPGEADASAVVVEASFTEAEYEIVVLSATEGDDLLAWLDQEGFSVPDSTASVLQGYLDAGSQFLAAKVALGAVPEGRTWLSPLQLRYPQEALALPIRIGTASAEPGAAQEVSVVVLGEGEVAISNYPEVTVEDACMWPEGEDFSDYYAGALETAFDEASSAGWVREYSWPLWKKCDPCTVPQAFTPEEMETLGAVGSGGYWLSRLRFRATPEQATDDLVFYDTKLEEAAQLRYVAYDHQLEYLFPTCGAGWAAEPGECPDAGEPALGCSVSVRPALSGLALAFALLWRRRDAR